MAKNILDSLLPLILPLIAEYADGAIPEAPKRWLYVQIVSGLRRPSLGPEDAKEFWTTRRGRHSR
ncbi:MAG: hypothetical protein IPG71_14270 [bacterium]|nr:hypothetical protein [bacterium]